jgi:exopolyphosphatase/guanosine-5'-triphosphate,3'-diphosphate pyrophosphatase
LSVVAAIDCGTNSIRLLVTDGVSDLAREMTIVRLGEGVDRTGHLDPAALERTRVALVAYARRIEALGASAVRMVATSATRDARNRADFIAMVRSVLGVEPEVVTGDEEARLSYAGATAGVEVAYPALIADIGGGSTELVLGDGPGSDAVRAASSVDIGCVRLTERRLHSDPPEAQEVSAARADIVAALERAREVVPLNEATTFVGLAGSVTTVVAHALGLKAYEAERIHGARIPAADVFAACDDLLRRTRAERAALPYMHPGRVDVIGGGAMIVAATLAASGCAALTASEKDILDGLALTLRPS